MRPPSAKSAVPGYPALEQWTLHARADVVSALPADLRRTIPVDGIDAPRLRAQVIEDIALLLRYTVH
jgi:hypothetical protein